MLLFFINSVGPQIAKKLLRLKNHTYQSMIAMTLKCYPGELKTGGVYHVHMICIHFWLYTFHFRADNAVTDTLWKGSGNEIQSGIQKDIPAGCL